MGRTTVYTYYSPGYHPSSALSFRLRLWPREGDNQGRIYIRPYGMSIEFGCLFLIYMLCVLVHLSYMSLSSTRCTSSILHTHHLLQKQGCIFISNLFLLLLSFWCVCVCVPTEKSSLVTYLQWTSKASQVYLVTHLALVPIYQ